MDPKPPSFILYVGSSTLHFISTQWKQNHHGVNYQITLFEYENITWNNFIPLWENKRKEYPKSNLTIQLKDTYIETKKVGKLNWSVLYGMIFMNVDRLITQE